MREPKNPPPLTSATEQHFAAGAARNTRYGNGGDVVGHRKPTVDCDAEISYCRQWVDAGVQQLNVSCSDLVQLLLGSEPGY